MRFAAQIESSRGRHEVSLSTGRRSHSIEIPPKPSGFGSGANGGELLFLALATCYCNDVYREAARRGLRVDRLEVEASGELGTEGGALSNVTYRVKVFAHGDGAEIRDLLEHTDRVAEIDNTVRAATPVTPAGIEISAA